MNAGERQAALDSARLRGGRFEDVRQAVELVRQAAEGLSAVHEKGLVHRDLKPGNVLLASGGRQPPEDARLAGGSRPPLASLTPKVTDFGLAKKLDEGTGPTRTGAVTGTPGYMAPEQAQGGRGAVGPRSDLSSLAVRVTMAFCALLFASVAVLHWRKDADLAGLRDEEALAALPAEERAPCRALWADVASRLGATKP
jgi:serine/threonine protein kinase